MIKLSAWLYFNTNQSDYLSRFLWVNSGSNHLRTVTQNIGWQSVWWKKTTYKSNRVQVLESLCCSSGLTTPVCNGHSTRIFGINYHSWPLVYINIEGIKGEQDLFVVSHRSSKYTPYYRTQVRSIGFPCQYWLTPFSLLFSRLDWCDSSVWCRFGSWSLVIKLNFQTLSTWFGQNVELEVEAKWR